MRLKRLVLFALMLTLIFPLAACDGDGGTLSIPSEAGEPLTEWTDDPMFADVPRFTAGELNADNSEIKKSYAVMVFENVEKQAYFEYRSSLVSANFSDEFGEEDENKLIQNGRFLSDDGEVLVRLLYRGDTKALTITLVPAE